MPCSPCYGGPSASELLVLVLVLVLLLVAVLVRRIILRTFPVVGMALGNEIVLSLVPIWGLQLELLFVLLLLLLPVLAQGFELKLGLQLGWVLGWGSSSYFFQQSWWMPQPWTSLALKWLFGAPSYQGLLQQLQLQEWLAFQQMPWLLTFLPCL